MLFKEPIIGPIKFKMADGRHLEYPLKYWRVRQINQAQLAFGGTLD